MKRIVLVGAAALAASVFAADEWLTSDDATMRVSANNQGRAFAFTNVAQAVTATAGRPLFVREVLVVGGGGAGGVFVGGGGGAGGVTNPVFATPLLLEAGATVSLSVGAGGEPVANKRGNSGKNSTLLLGGTTYTALGGGGGGGWNGGKQGLDGGCGGGSCCGSGLVNALGSQGGNGGLGVGWNPAQYNAGGGGGAGGDGENVPVGGDKTRAPAGGIGIYSLITGEGVWYAGGGGAGGFGNNNNTPLKGGPGGLGGGGQGNGNDLADAQSGTDGLGGGGGGTANSNQTAGRGGNGTVILLVAEADGTPIEDPLPDDVSSEFATVSGSLYHPGFGAETANVYVQLYEGAGAQPGAEVGAEVCVATAIVPGATWSRTFYGLDSNATYSYRVRIVNALDKVRVRMGEFTTCEKPLLDFDDPTARCIEHGLTRVQVFTNAGLASLSVAVQNRAFLRRAFLVGGGGSGGSFVGAGGGAGGVTNFYPATPLVLEAGETVLLSVGAGGASVNKSGSGKNGKASSLSVAGLEFVADGGGAGGGFGSAGDGAGYGQNGGCGGGCFSHKSSRATGTQGGAGGIASTDHGNYNAAGGGGAGGDGEDSGLWGYHAPGGGIGVSSDITFEEVWYAGGGGASGYRNINPGQVAGGAGGKGGGGAGAGTDRAVAESGTDGLGGGGGGSVNGNNVSGAGGCGTVILSLAPANGLPIEDAEAPVVGATSVAVGGTLYHPGYGAKAATVGVSLAVGDGEFGEERIVARNLTVGLRWRGSFKGLAPSTACRVKVRIWNELGFVTSRIESFVTAAEVKKASGQVTCNEWYYVGTDKVCVFTNALGGDFTFVAIGMPKVRMLVVGGGGAGGTTIGGGGGAGGYIERDGVELKAGTHTVHVGAGGTASSGEDTVVTKDGGAELFRAFGGGKGANWDGASVDGGSGGGASSNDTVVRDGGRGVEGQGHDGGQHNGSNSQSLSGGGGGAGGPGGKGGDVLCTGGSGGEGKASDISGELRWYAGGGGAGGCLSTDAKYDTVSLGGSGIGGNGSANHSGLPGKDGAESTGSGGGGGSWSPGTAGGKGGSGIVIIRYSDPDHVLRPTLADAGGQVVVHNEAQVFWTVAWPGSGKSGVTMKAQIGTEPGVYRKTVTVATDTIGADSGWIPNLYPGVVNYIRLVADNGTVQTEGEEFVLTAGPARPGLMILLK